MNSERKAIVQKLCTIERQPLVPGISRGLVGVWPGGRLNDLECLDRFAACGNRIAACVAISTTL